MFKGLDCQVDDVFISTPHTLAGATYERVVGAFCAAGLLGHCRKSPHSCQCSWPVELQDTKFIITTQIAT